MRRAGPVLGSHRVRRRDFGVWKRLALFVALVAGAWLWVVEIGGDLAGGRYLGTTQPGQESLPAAVIGTPGAASAATVATEAGSTAAAHAGTKAGGPAEAALPVARAALTGDAPMDPTRRALIAAARDAIARGVRPTRGSVPDLRALRGNSADLVERALDQVAFPLRAALIAHRVREPRRYGLVGRAGAGDIDPNRVLDVETLTVFLDTFAERIDAADDSRWRAGDLVLVADRKHHGATTFAIVGEQTDLQGVSLLFTMDSRDGRARADRSASEFEARSAWRLSRARLDEARRTLGVAPQPRGSAG